MVPPQKKNCPSINTQGSLNRFHPPMSENTESSEGTNDVKFGPLKLFEEELPKNGISHGS